MTDDDFWALVGRTVADTRNEQAGLLRTVLGELAPDEIVAFEAAFRQQARRANTWDVRGAAHIVRGVCTDHEFLRFRKWLVSRGHGPFERILAAPDDLADILPQRRQARRIRRAPWQQRHANPRERWALRHRRQRKVHDYDRLTAFEELDGIVGEAWRRTSGEDTHMLAAAVEALDGPAMANGTTGTAIGEADLAARYPKLWRLTFGQ